ncbi:hypothetical protein LCGC14_0185120 [marine sediment metagenome]|uniref:Uncharacterized protein n=1 Tax=marine sediment metagenome TaxID=412755 RepID=A0A0F9X6V8_9ZZZZ|nr:hypothetical protein [Halomonas sp.]HDZ49294.1 hypothetical protein [Halomonas sp.]HEB05141.1 hypothetical protein [Halomonas sp.]
MTKTIRHVNELPDWFDIRHYEHWEDKNPYEAARAVDDRLWLRRFTYSICGIHPEDKNLLDDQGRYIMLESLADTSRQPFQSHSNEIFLKLFHHNNKIHHGDDYAQFRKNEEQEEDAIDLAGLQEAERIIGSGSPLHKRDGVSRVTLWDVMDWMEENKDTINEIERTAQHLADQHGWDVESVRSAIQGHIPVWGSDGSDFLVVNDFPTIPAVLNRIENHLRSLPIRHNDADKARYSDVRKMFEYRVAAYADLTSWSHLTDCTITKKCMANALFPDGRYGEIDMMPSKTVGRFIQRVEQGYIDDLTAKAAEMKTMQS